MKKHILLIVLGLLFFTGCVNKQSSLKKNIQNNVHVQNKNKFNLLKKLNTVEIMTAKDCAALFGKTLQNASSSEIYCKNFMLYMTKLNQNSQRFCNIYKIKGLLPYQCYEISTIGFELKNKYNQTVNYKLIASIYKKIIAKYKKYGTYSTANLMLKEKILQEVVNRYIEIIKNKKRSK